VKDVARGPAAGRAERTAQAGADRIDHAAMRLANQLAILRAVRDGGSVTRIAVQRRTGLSWGTVTTLVRELVDRRLVEERGPLPTRAGRHPVEIGIDRRARRVAGLRLGGQEVSAVVMDLAGGVEAAVSLPAGAGGSGQAILERMYRCLDRAMERSGTAPRSLAGIGIALPGAVDYASGTGLYGPHHPRWRNVPVRDLFQRRYGAPCFVDHDNNCAVMGEWCFGLARGIDDFLCVALGTGLSVGIMIRGEVYRGADFMAGELGHVVVDPAGPRCACGRKGCLEALASGRALARAAEALARGGRSPRLLEAARGDPRRVTAAALFDAAEDGDAEARRAFAAMGGTLGRGLAMLVNLFNPARIILCGGVSRAHAWFLPAARRTLRESAWRYSRADLAVSELEDSSTWGAAGIVLHQAFTTGLLFSPGAP
jgi:N-acetylglucosamine repressor